MTTDLTARITEILRANLPDVLSAESRVAADGYAYLAEAVTEAAEEHYRPRIEELGRAIGVLSDTVHELQCRQPGLTQPAADPRTFGPDHHDFLPVREHSDDDECAYRSDGTDATYCGLIRARHELWSPGAGK